MKTNWVIVADSSRARIFSSTGRNSPLIEIETLVHPEARLHQGDLVSDHAGHEGGAAAVGHDLGGEPGARHEEAVRFAHQLIQVLEKARSSGRFEQLYIIAAPAFLGIMRKYESNALRQRVVREVSKNLTTHRPATIHKCLQDNC